MKNLKYNFKNLFWILIPVLALTFIVGCGDDDPEPPTTEDPVASFQFAVSETNFLEVTFSNFSQNATTYAWEFGDGNTSTDKDPVHTYAAAGTYTVVLTASNGTRSATKTETISLTDPNAQLTLLTGGSSKTWYLQREGIALGIGPGIDDNAWWSFGGVTPLADRPCILDDSFTFHADGTFEFSSGGTIFIDAAGCCGGWHETEGCWDESDPDVWGDNPSRAAFGDGGNYTFELDNVNGTLTLLGEGAFIGLPNKTESGDNPDPVQTKTYTIFNFVDGDGVDSLGIALDGVTWNFYLVAYENPADLPPIPTATPRANFEFGKDGFTVTFTNTSANSTNYSWDFGDGGSSTEVDPVHTYAAEGDYDVTLVAMDDNGNMDMVTKTVSVSAAVFTPAVLSSENGKVWKLAGEGSYKVGDAPGSGVWWGGPSAEDVTGARACQFDDEWIFFDDGTMVYDAKGSVWAEPYMGGPNDCVAEADLTAPYDVFASGTHAFEVVEGDPTQIKTVGLGAFIGFNKPFTGGELNNDGTTAPVSEITYDVLEFTSTATRDIVVLTIDYVGDGCCYWTISIESEK